MSRSSAKGAGGARAAERRGSKPARRAPEPEAGYHHGDLQEALIAATEQILAEGGAESFTLREAARRAGVSPAAPSHHFGNAPGLLTEVAVRGYAELTQALEAAVAADVTPEQKLHAQGAAYVRFALEHPGRFQMMFSNKRLLSGDERLHAAAKAAYLPLETVMRDMTGGERNAGVAATAAWSAVHGFAKLALEGKFGPVGSEKSHAAILAQLRQVLGFLWPLMPTVRPTR